MNRVIPLLLSLISISSLHAESLYWDGDSNDNWRNDTNWTNSDVAGSNHKPNSDDNAWFSFAYANDRNEVDLENGSGTPLVRQVANVILVGSGSNTNILGRTWTFNNGSLQIDDSLSWRTSDGGWSTVSMFGDLTVPVGVTTKLGSGSVNNYTLNFNGTFIGDGALEKKGTTRTINLLQASPFTGSYLNIEGTTKISHDDALANATVERTGGNLTFNTTDPNFAMLIGSGNISVPSGTTLGIGKTNLSNTYSGSLNGNGNVLKAGTGTWTLDASSGLNGSLSCEQGLVELDHPDSLHSAIVTPAASGEIQALQDTRIGTLSGTGGTFNAGAHTVRLDKQAAGTLSYAGILNSSGTLIYDPGDAGAILTFNPDLSSIITGTIEIESGTLTNTSSALTQATIKVTGNNGFSTPTFSIIGALEGTGDIDLGGSLSFGSNNTNTTYSGTITRTLGSGSLRKQGSGNWQFDGATIGNWNVFIDAGTLSGNNTLNGTLAIASGATLSPGTSPGTVTVVGDTTLSGSYLCEIDGSSNDLLEVSGNLDISSATIDFDVLGGGTTQSTYIIATYGSLTGTFSSVLDLPAGYVVDYNYDDGSSSNNVALIVNTPPNATAITSSGSPLGEFTVTFDKPVINFDAFNDLVLNTTAGTASATGASISGNGSTYTVQLTGLSGSGSLTLAIDTSSNVEDKFSNALASSVTSSAISFDLVLPSISSIVPSTTGPTNGNGLSFDITFSENVINFDSLSDLLFSGDITVGSASFDNTGPVYTVTVSDLSGDGTLTLAVQTGNGIQDIGGNLLASSPTSATVTIDAAPPTAAVSTVTSSPTAASTLDYQITFSEPVQNFNAEADLAISTTGDAAYSSATISDTGDATTFNISLLGVTGGSGDLELAASTGSDVEDLLGNPLLSSTSSSITIDKIGPAVTGIVPATTGPTGAASLDFDVFFSETVLNFDTFADLNLVTTGTATATGASFTGSGDTYTVTLTGVSGVGTLSLELVVPGDITDSQGNALTSTLTSAPVTLTADQELLWLLEEGTGTTTTESISGETTIATFNGPVTWTSPVSPNSLHAIGVDNDSPVPSYINAGTKKTDNTYVAGSDPAFKVLSNNWSITGWIRLDATQNQTGDRVIASSDWDSSNGWTFFVKDGAVQEGLGFDFGSGRTQSNLSLPLDEEIFIAILGDNSASFGSGNKHRFAVWDGLSWQFQDGTNFSHLRLQGIELGSFNDGQRQFEGALDEIRIYSKTLSQPELEALVADTSPPTATSITPTGPTPTNATTVDFDVTFRKPVVNFNDFSDLVVGGTATATGATFSGSGENYTVTLTGVSGDGPLTLAANTASDIEDTNGLALASSVTSTAVEIDNTSPTATITAITPSPAHSSTLEFAVNFSENVVGFTSSDLSVSFSGLHGTPQITGSDDSYTVSIPQVDGDALLTLSFAGITNTVDLVGNPLSPGSSSDSINVDTIGADATFARVTSHPTNGTEAVFSLSFTSTIVNLDPSDLQITYGGTFDPPVISGSNSPYTITFSNIVGDDNMTISLAPSNDIEDGDGNSINEYNSSFIRVDNIAPTVSLARALTTPSPTNNSTVEFLVTFSEQVDSIHMDDFLINFSGTHSPPQPWTENPKQFLESDENGFRSNLTTFCLRIPNVVGTGDMTVSMNSSTSIVDELGNPFIPGTAQATIAIDQTPPSILSITPDTTGPTTNSSVSFQVAFNEPVIQQPFPESFAVTHTGTSHTNLTAVPDPDQQSITVTVSGLAGNGFFTLEVGDLNGIVDLAGNALLSSPTSAAVTHVDPFDYDDWATHHGLTPLNDDPGDDPDGDGKTNGQEFAYDEDPLSSATGGKRRALFLQGDTEAGLTLTFPVRLGANFTNDPITGKLNATIDSIHYIIDGSESLTEFNTPVALVGDALDTGLPELNPGWEYRSFRLSVILPLTPKGFLRDEADFIDSPPL